MADSEPTQVCMRMRNKSPALKIQMRDAEVLVVSLFYDNPCVHFEEREFTFFDAVAVDPWTRHTLASHRIRFEYADTPHGPRIRDIVVLADVEDRDATIEAIVSTMATFQAKMDSVRDSVRDVRVVDLDAPLGPS